MASKRFEPEKVIDLSVDWYGLLGLEKGSLPPYGVRKDNEKIASILERAWRRAARKVHPDLAHDEAQINQFEQLFRLIFRAHEFLSNPLFRAYIDSDGAIRPKNVGEGVHEIDLDSVGTYVEGSLADTTGYGLFRKICLSANDIGLVPAYRPKSKMEAYEWDFAIVGTDKDSKGNRKEPSKLTIAIVEDEDDVFRLTDGGIVEDSLPFKIYICIPRVAPKVRRTKDQLVTLDDGTQVVWQGSVKRAQYDDYELLSSTRLEDAENYIYNELEEDIAAYKAGTLVKKKQEEEKSSNQISWMKQGQINAIDAQALRDILKRKTWETTPDPHAADFLGNFRKQVGDSDEAAASPNS
jgi:curved DNA-binding protein CbpA